MLRPFSLFVSPHCSYRDRNTEAYTGLVTDSYIRNELIRICHDSDGEPKPVRHLNGQICQICSDTVGLAGAVDVFVACNVCAFSVCRPCYEYERKHGNQSCPQCRTRESLRGCCKTPMTMLNLCVKQVRLSS